MNFRDALRGIAAQASCADAALNAYCDAAPTEKTAGAMGSHGMWKTPMAARAVSDTEKRTPIWVMSPCFFAAAKKICL